MKQNISKLHEVVNIWNTGSKNWHQPGEGWRGGDSNVNDINTKQKRTLPKLNPNGNQNLNGRWSPKNVHPRSVYRHSDLPAYIGKISMEVVMDALAQMSLSYGTIISIFHTQLLSFFSSAPCSRLGRTPCLYTVLRWKICRPYPSKFWHAIWIEKKANKASIRRFFLYRIKTNQLIPIFFGSKRIEPI